MQFATRAWSKNERKKGALAGKEEKDAGRAGLGRTADEKNPLGVAQLEAHEQRHDLQAVRAAVHKVANEEVAHKVNVPGPMIGRAVAPARRDWKGGATDAVGARGMGEGGAGEPAGSSGGYRKNASMSGSCPCRSPNTLTGARMLRTMVSCNKRKRKASAARGRRLEDGGSRTAARKGPTPTTNAPAPSAMA